MLHKFAPLPWGDGSLEPTDQILREAKQKLLCGHDWSASLIFPIDIDIQYHLGGASQKCPLYPTVLLRRRQLLKVDSARPSRGRIAQLGRPNRCRNRRSPARGRANKAEGCGAERIPTYAACRLRAACPLYGPGGMLFPFALADQSKPT